MGFLDWLTGKIECPRCGTRGAKEINGRIHCTNPTCAYFSTTMGKSGADPEPLTFSQPVDVPAGSIAIQYRNFRGVGKTFVAEAASARRTRNHISVKIAEDNRMVWTRNPQTGEPMRVPREVRISLSRDRILNLNEVDAAIPQRLAPGQDWPTPRERQVLAYHKYHRSTSPLYESLRAKYPHW